jgi:serine/threonine protein kinase
MTNLIGQSLGRYHILEQLGEGGMATVYKAYDTRLERDVAVKIIRKTAFSAEILEKVLARFEREAKSLAKLTHPNIVKVHDYGDHEGSPYLVLEYLPGGTLKQALGKPIPWQDALQLLLPIARGLAYAHQRGIIHRDVKPANILITESGEPLLSDFGIAKLLENEDGQTLTGSGVGIGTPEYMSPEQGAGKAVDARADIYSLGIVLYEMLTGRKPYTADTPMAVVLKQMTDPLPRPSDVNREIPSPVEKILIKALAKKPQDRYESMNDFIQVMEACLVRKPAGGRSLPLIASRSHSNDEKTVDQVIVPVTRASGRKTLWILVAAFIVVAVILGGILGWSRLADSSQKATLGPVLEKTSTPSKAEPTLSRQPVAITSTETITPSGELIFNETPINPNSAIPTSNTHASPKILLEDHFDIQKFNGSYNGLLWSCDGCLPNLVFQQDGVFNINISSSSETTSRDLRSINSWTYAQVGYIQARLKLSNYKGSRHADVHAQLWADFQDYQWWTSCDVLMESSSSDKGFFNCHDGRIYTNGSSTNDYSTSLIPVNTNEWQTVRIEIEPETFQLNYYLNGELIGERVPSDADKLKVKTLTPDFGIWAEGMTSFTAYLDDLIVGSR